MSACIGGRECPECKVRHLTEAERELLSGLCENEAPKGAGYDGYCFKHFTPVRWQGQANAHDVCCVYVEDCVERVLQLRLASGQEGDA